MQHTKKLLRYWPLLILLLLEVSLFLTNYTPGTFLMGWDNVMPEFNFRANFERSLFGVWQEHRGLGLYDGMSHTANLLHTTFLWLLSFVLPQSLLRYTFTFLTHFLGGVGVYFLLKFLIKENHFKNLIALIGSVFYLFNIATVQMFFTPLESFSVHFAALPWLAFTLLNYFHTPTKKSLLWFYIVSFLATAQFFVTTLFIPTVILLSILSGHFLLTHEKKSSFKKIVTAGTGFLLINAFWLLPYLYGLPKNAPVIANAKINQQSTPEIFARNQAFGDLTNTLFLRGFLLDGVDTTPDDTNNYLMAVWRDHGQTIPVVIIAVVFVLFVLIGIVHSRKHTYQQFVPFVAIFCIGFFMLGNDIVGLREVNAFLRQTVPFFSEAFRFPFTKFSLLFALSQSILLGLGLAAVVKWRILSIITIAIMLGYYMSPAFLGNFIFRNMRQKLLQEYVSLFQFMNGVDPHGRVAYLPQPAFWSWKHYRWGYTGSGFVWYGLSQPLLDRAFDPWSMENENYFWELSRALYTKKPEQLETVFDKYDIRYIIIDGNLQGDTSYLALYIDYSKEMLKSNSKISELATFGKITLYERNNPNLESFVSLKQRLPTVFPLYRATDNDVAYRDQGDYASFDVGTGEGTKTYVYPYRALFTKRASTEREFTITESENALEITATLNSKPRLDLSQFTLTQSIESVPDSSLKLAGNEVRTTFLKADRLVFDSTQYQSLNSKDVIKCGGIRDGEIEAENVTKFNESWLRLESKNQRVCLSFGIPAAWHRDGYIVAVASRNIIGRPILFALINQTAKQTTLETYLPRRDEQYDPNGWETTYFVLPPLADDGVGYTVYIANDSIGRQKSINEIGHVYAYKIPYDELVNIHWESIGEQSQKPPIDNTQFIVKHTNPVWYNISLQSDVSDATIMLSQAFDTGWVAFTPSLQLLSDHVIVNNWMNGWKIGQGQKTIYLFFWPQLLEWLGFALLPIPFIYALWKRPEKR